MVQTANPQPPPAAQESARARYASPRYGASPSPLGPEPESPEASDTLDEMGAKLDDLQDSLLRFTQSVKIKLNLMLHDIDAEPEAYDRYSDAADRKTMHMRRLIEKVKRDIKTARGGGTSSRSPTPNYEYCTGGACARSRSHTSWGRDIRRHAVRKWIVQPGSS